MPFRYPWVLSCALGCLVVACGSNADGGADGNDGAQTDGSPDQVGSVCEVPADCYPEVDPEGLAGEVLCLDRVRAGYCTHECSDDAECCAVEGECLTDQLGNGTLIDQSKPVLVAGLQADPLAPATDGSDQTQESAVNMDWSGLPSACNKPTKIAATNRFLHGDFAVASAYATSSGAGKYVNVHLASFKMDPKRLYDGPRGNQFALELSFGKVDLASKTASGVDVGQYVFGLDTERKVMSTVKHKSGTETLMQLSLAGASPGSVTIRHLDGTWICGELALATKESTFTGPFAARIGA